MELLAVGLCHGDHVLLATEYLNLVIKFNENVKDQTLQVTSSATSGPLLVKFCSLLIETLVLMSSVK